MTFEDYAEVESEIVQAGSLERFLVALDSVEVEVVSRTVAACDALGLQRIARTATWLGNGTLYPLLALFLVVAAPIDEPSRFLMTVSLSLVMAFAIYPPMKTLIARLRPCHYDPSLARTPEPLDHYSCPSGHAMTAAAFAIPVVFACRPAAPIVLAACAIISWSRVALGHHYVSDVVAGTILGATVALLVSALLY